MQVIIQPVSLWNLNKSNVNNVNIAKNLQPVNKM